MRRRALRSGGRLCFVCWRSVFENEWMLIPGAAVMSVTGSPPPMPGPEEPGPFSLAEPDRVRSVLDDAGFTNVEVEPHADHVVMAEEEIGDIVATSIRVGAAREALREADDETRTRAVAAVEDALRARLREGQVRATRGFNLVVAQA